MIDEKGRIFSKLNIIDAVVWLVIFAIIAAGAYTFKTRQSQSQAALQPQTDGEVYVTVVARLVPEEVGTQLQIGDKLVAKGAYTNAEIVSIDITPAKWVAWTDEGIGINTVHPIWKDVTVVIKDKSSSTAPIVKAGGQEARTGITTFVLKTQKVEAPATVLDVTFK